MEVVALVMTQVDTFTKVGTFIVYRHENNTSNQLDYILPSWVCRHPETTPLKTVPVLLRWPHKKQSVEAFICVTISGSQNLPQHFHYISFQHRCKNQTGNVIIKLIGYENIQASLFTFVFFSSFHAFKKRVCNKYILTHACVLRIYMEILENLVSLIKTLGMVYPSIHSRSEQSSI